jgi:hypothetical protein
MNKFYWNVVLLGTWVGPSQFLDLSALYLEYRTSQGFNSRLQNLTEVDLSSYYPNLQKQKPFYQRDSAIIQTAGVQVRAGFFVDGQCRTTYLIDSKPNSIIATHPEQSYSLYDSLDSFFLPGQKLVEPNNKIEISVEGLNTQGGMSVRIRSL